MTNKFNFTKKTIDALPLPENGKRASYSDEKERGLIIRVSHTGRKVYQLYKKYKGSPIRITLGYHPELTVEKARKYARAEKNKLDEGINSNQEKQAFRDEDTLETLFNSYMERYSKKTKKSWQYDEREIPKFLGHWFNRKISNISKLEIARLHERIRDNNGLYQANRMLERIRAMYNKAIEWGWNGENPSNGIKKFTEKSRERFIQPNEIPLIFKALDEEENITARDYILMSLYTGARKTNVLCMKWEEIDWYNKQWNIPETKNGEPVILPLMDCAIEILENRKDISKFSPWVFASNESKTGHLADPKKSWDRVRQRATIYLYESNKNYLSNIVKEAKETVQDDDIRTLYKTICEIATRRKIELPIGLTDLRLHDIRRTFGSYQAITGSNTNIIAKSLGHKSEYVTKVYSRLNNDPIRASIERAMDKIMELKEG